MVKNITICSLLLLTLAVAKPVFACTCIEPPPPQEAAQQAAAVFTGTVVSVTQVGNQQEVRIRVERVWKGAKCGEVTILTPLDEAACGYTFQTGQSYLVYAERQQGKLSTNLCSRTNLTSQAGGDLTALGEPKEVCQ